jgi:hypothetical protein
MGGPRGDCARRMVGEKTGAAMRSRSEDGAGGGSVSAGGAAKAVATTAENTHAGW